MQVFGIYTYTITSFHADMQKGTTFALQCKHKEPICRKFTCFLHTAYLKSVRTLVLKASIHRFC